MESVVSSWVDAWGNDQVVAPEDLALVTSLLGEFEPLPYEPVYVAWDGILDVVTPVAWVITEHGERVEVSATLPLGYHRLIVDGVDVALVISAPVAAFPAPERATGIFAPVYELRREGDWGIGDAKALDVLGAAFSDVVSIVGTTPMLAKYSGDASPYSPVSRAFWSEEIIDVGRLGAGSAASPALVDYEAVSNRTDETIERHLGTLRGTAAWLAVIAEAGEDVTRFARFRALAEQMGSDWRAWDTEVAPEPRRMKYHLLAQHLADGAMDELEANLKARGQTLYVDLPIGASSNSFDVWSEPEIYAKASMGAPPDDLFRGGQSWGLPPVIPEAGRRSGHANFIKVVQHHMANAGIVRVDHILGLYRSWWVPDGMPATAGAYVLPTSRRVRSSQSQQLTPLPTGALL